MWSDAEHVNYWTLCVIPEGTWFDLRLLNSLLGHSNALVTFTCLPLMMTVLCKSATQHAGTESSSNYMYRLILQLLTLRFVFTDYM
jgi:hypothetical protein